MPYGQAGRLGESIDPRLMQADYSGYAKAGMMQGQALANMGKQIGDVIKQRAEQKKQDAVDEKFLQQGSEFFKGTPLETTFADAYQNYTSEDMTPRDKRALATSIKSLIPMGVEAHKMRMAEAEMQMRQAAMGAKGASTVWTGTREQLDEYLKSGWIVKGKHTINPDGTVTAELATPSPGLFGTGASSVITPDGSITINPPGQGTRGASMPGVSSAQIRDAASGFQQPSSAGGYDPSMIGQMAQPPSLPIGGGGGVGPGVLPPRGFQPGDLAGQPLQMPTQQPQTPLPSPQELAAASEMAKQDIPVVEDGRIKGFTQMKGSMLALEAKRQQQQIAKDQMEIDKAEAEKAAKQQAEISKQSDKLIAADTFFDDVDRAIALLDKSSPRVGVVGGVSRQLGAKVPGTVSYDLQENYIKPLTSQIMLASLAKLKESSPTGASGLGALNQSEADSLRESWGAIKIGGDPAILRENLLRIKRRRFDLIHGTKEERDKALQQGKITQQQYDIVDRMEKQTFPSEFATPQLAPTPFAPDVEALINKYTK